MAACNMKATELRWRGSLPMSNKFGFNPEYLGSFGARPRLIFLSAEGRTDGLTKY
jgi:hypothetical protein